MVSRMLLVACAALTALFAARTCSAFAVGQVPKVGSGSAAHAAPGNGSTGSICGAVLGLLAAGGLAARSVRRNRGNAFSSSSSGFMGTQCASSYISSPAYYEAPTEIPQPVFQPTMPGVASMGMKAQVWWVKNTGFDGPKKGGARIFDSRRRESRRRGEELFRHDTGSFEFCVHNLIEAPGANKKKIVRGRGKYGHHGRTCGYGTTKNGAHKRGRRTLNPGYEGNQKPLHLKTPKLTKDQLDSMKQDPYTPVDIRVLNMCEDGDEVDYMDLFTRGFPVRPRKKFDRVKIKATDGDDCLIWLSGSGFATIVLTTKNLTVYAHAFEPPAREKIELNGGRCIRLSDVGSLPIDARWLSTNEFKVGGSDDGDAGDAEGEEEASE